MSAPSMSAADVIARYIYANRANDFIGANKEAAAVALEIEGALESFGWVLVPKDQFETKLPHWNDLPPQRKLALVEIIAVPGQSWTMRAQAIYEFLREVASRSESCHDELVAALKAFEDALRGFRYNSDQWPELRDARILARAALLKAEGK